MFFALGIGYLTTPDKGVGVLSLAAGVANVVIGLIRFVTRKASPEIAKPS